MPGGERFPAPAGGLQRPEAHGTRSAERRGGLRMSENGAAELVERVAADPRYRELVRRRSRLTWTLTAIILVIFFGYILLIAFDKELLARPAFGGTTSLGIPLGIGVILAGILLTGIYVWRASRDLDPLAIALHSEAGR
jgi:uncharacterized membrane protein (DUF485 family)